MRMRSIMIRPIILSFAILATAACVERTPELLQSGNINYSVDVAGSVETKGILYNDAESFKDGFFVVDCYQSGSSAAYFSGEKVKYTDGSWTAVTTRVWPEDETLKFYANANVPSPSIASVISTVDGQTLTYSKVPATASSQNDIMLGYYSGDGTGTSGTGRHEAEIVFRHPLTSVVFRLGEMKGFTEDDKITKISLDGVYASGTCDATYTSTGASFVWTPDRSVIQVVRDAATNGLAIAAVEKMDIGTPFVLIPQDISKDDVILTINLTLNGVEKELNCHLSGPAWKSGETAVYAINYDALNFGLSVTRWNETDPVEEKVLRSGDDWVCFEAPTEHVLGMKGCYGDLQPGVFYYSYDKQIWTKFDYSTDEIPFGDSYGAVYVYGDNSGDPRNNFIIDRQTDTVADVDVSGNVMSLVSPDYAISYNGGYGPNFTSLFEGCSQIVHADRLKLPATKFLANCYRSMFEGCTSLETAPELPSTDLADECYYRMFSGCTSLKTAPELLATDLADWCYSFMFEGCTSLETAPELPATILSWGCYWSMFEGCTSLNTAIELPATSLAESCYRNMFSGCTSLTVAPELPSTNLANKCYYGMFSGCTSLTTAPELPSTDLAERCYYEMFKGCTSLTTAPELSATNLTEYCYWSMFSGCTSLTTAPELSSTNLESNCYGGMFYGCTSLTTAPELPATNLAERCYDSMFLGCGSLTTAPELPATELAEMCYYEMFSGCKSLTTAPELPANKLAEKCYCRMFIKCKSLNKVTMLATDVDATDCLTSWLYGVAIKGEFVKAKGASLPEGDSGIPKSWTVTEVEVSGN